MRIIVVSDTHRDFNAFFKLLEAQMDNADLFLHLGDGEREIASAMALRPGLPLYSVRGNCDIGAGTPEARVIDADGVKIYMTHGHLAGVKNSLSELENRARAAGASIALYGHTHAQYYEYRNGLHIMNPGSLVMPRGTPAGYGVVEVRDKQILCSLRRLGRR